VADTHQIQQVTRYGQFCHTVGIRTKHFIEIPEEEYFMMHYDLNRLNCKSEVAPKSCARIYHCILLLKQKAMLLRCCRGTARCDVFRYHLICREGTCRCLSFEVTSRRYSAKLTRKQAAYASIANSAYLGPRKGFTFASYVTLHQSAHNELLDLEEPVSESKKVTDFLKGIRDPSLNTGKSFVLGDPSKLGDFEECQQYFSTIVQNMSAQTKSERQVSSAVTDGGGGRGGSSVVDRIKGCAYSDEQFRALSPDDKRRVQKYRDDAKKKKRSKNKDRKEKR
jgi:hypothetical protein